MKKMPSEIEKKMLEKDAVMLAIGTAIAMVLVWLTITVPPKEHRAYTSECYEICKVDVSQTSNFEEGGMLTRTKFIIAMGKCMDKCVEVKNAENKSIPNKE
jgi:hypothetical protein